MLAAAPEGPSFVRTTIAALSSGNTTFWAVNPDAPPPWEIERRPPHPGPRLTPRPYPVAAHLFDDRPCDDIVRVAVLRARSRLEVEGLTGICVESAVHIGRLSKVGRQVIVHVVIRVPGHVRQELSDRDSVGRGKRRDITRDRIVQRETAVETGAQLHRVVLAQGMIITVLAFAGS